MLEEYANKGLGFADVQNMRIRVWGLPMYINNVRNLANMAPPTEHEVPVRFPAQTLERRGQAGLQKKTGIGPA